MYLRSHIQTSGLVLAMALTGGCEFGNPANRGLQALPGLDSIRLSHEHATLYVGAAGGDEARFPSARQFSAQVIGAAGELLEGTAAEISWSTSDASVAVVDARGLVRAQASGSILLTAASAARPQLVATASVLVLDAGGVSMSVR